MKCLFLATVMLTGAAVGCNGALTNQHAQMMDAMRGTIKDASSRLGSSGTGQVQAGGHVINPGIKLSASITYSAEASYVGVAGQVQAASQGNLDREVSAEDQESARAIWSNTAIDVAERRETVRSILYPWTDAAIDKFLGPAPEAK